MTAKQMTKDCYLITGGAGFIGSNFVRHLLRDSEIQVVVLDKLTYAGNRLNLNGVEKSRLVFIQNDISNVKIVRKIYQKYRPAYVVNLAAETHVDRSIDDPEIFIRTNVTGTFVLLHEGLNYYSRLSGEDKKSFRFLQVSTDEVYGSLGPKGQFKESTPYHPNSPYSASKAGADHLAGSYYHTYRFPAMISNCSNNYGPYQFPEKLIPLAILNALEGKPIPLYGDGENVRDWLYVEDHCEALKLILKKGKPGEKYNIGGNQEKKNKDVLKKICHALDRLRPASKNPHLFQSKIRYYHELITLVKDRPGHDRRYAIDATYIKRELGWVPRHNFKAGIEQTVLWYLKNLDWCRKVQEGKYDRKRLGLRRLCEDA